jgi:hypothetical protein
MPSRDLDFAAEFGNKPNSFRRKRPLCYQASLLTAAAAAASLFTYWWFVSGSSSCSAASLHPALVVETANDVLRGPPTLKFRGSSRA